MSVSCFHKTDKKNIILGPYFLIFRIKQQKCLEPNKRLVFIASQTRVYLPYKKEGKPLPTFLRSLVGIWQQQNTHENAPLFRYINIYIYIYMLVSGPADESMNQHHPIPVEFWQRF
jgi:hypothetical protein